MRNLTRLCSVLPETPYHPVIVNGEVIAPGIRECHKRWEKIRPYIGHNKVIFDVGSDVGYFSQKIAEEFPENLVVSFEPSERPSLTQRELLRMAGITNVVLCRRKMCLDMLHGLVETVEGIDTALLLSVLHHLPIEEAKDWILHFSSFCPQLIIELPLAWEYYERFPEIVRQVYENFEIIGECTNQDDDQPRTLYRAWNEFLERDRLTPTFTFHRGIEHKRRTHRLDYCRGQWTHLKMRVIPGPYEQCPTWVPGISAWTLLYWNPIWPEPKWWTDAASVTCVSRIKHGAPYTDAVPQNFVRTAKGMVLIDEEPGTTVEQMRQQMNEKTLKVFGRLCP